MVFESLVVELINRYLGDFVENLDTSQLKIGIWGGDVVLNNLNLKESALDDLDLPVKIKAGHIGKLVLKIPWKNLYKEAVVAEIDGIYALAIPNVGIKYNAEKEEKAKQDAKQKKLAQIEEAKKLEAQKGQPKEEKQDSFAEKLATQVIKNLQVRVSNIHVRYEDRFTNPKRPFSIGLTLQDLLFQTTDENWKTCVIKDAVTQIYKLIKLDSLSVYWNSCSPMLDGHDKEQILENLKSNVASQGHRTGYHFIVRPISSVAHLRLNTKPEQTNFTIPKIGLTVVFDEIAVGLTKDQYDDVLEMLESMERMNLLSLYRKYRPDLALSGNARAWWHYAYASVLEETVRRRRRMWSWSHIMKHRQTMKSYREAYVKKLDSKKLSADLQKVIEEGERDLDVFSITVMRQQAEVEAAKLGAKRKEEASKGWFGGWFGGGGGKKQEDKKEASGAEEMQKQFYSLYTADEKAKLYSAIGYEENEADLTLPVEFVAVKVVTKLRNVSVFLRDVHQTEPQVLKLQLKDVYSSLGQRPAASAIQLEAKVDKLIVSGMPQNDFVPKMITSQVADKEQVYSLLTIAVETNPLDGLCDTSVKVKARPLEIIYDAQTVNKLAEFFKPPESVQLKQFSQAAMAKFDEIKEQSSTGIQFAIEQHKYTDISVDLMSSYIIVPEGGIMKGKGKVLVLDLGHLQVSSQKHDASVQSKESLEEKMQKAYDKFNIQLQRIQLLLAQPDDNWRLARDEGESPLHILSPISIILDLHKCILQDPRMAKMKVSGVLPNISIQVSDTRVKEILSLVQSIPFPESPPPQESVDDELFKGPSHLPTGQSETNVSISKVVQVAQEDTQGGGEKRPDMRKSLSVEYTNFTDMELTFEIKEVMVAIRRQEGESIKPYLRLVVKSIGTNVKMRTFDMVADAYLGAVFVQHLQYQLDSEVSQQLKSMGASGGAVVNLVNTPVSTDADYTLLTVHYLQANKKGPEFSTTYNNTEQTVHVTFCALELLLHQGAILSLMEFAQSLVPPAAQAPAVDGPEVSKSLVTTEVSKKSSKVSVSGMASPALSQSPSSISATSDKPVARKRKPRRESLTAEGLQRRNLPQADALALDGPRPGRVKPEDLEVIQMKVVAILNQFSVGLCNDRQLLTQVHIKGIEANVVMQVQQMKIGAVLKEMAILDPDPRTCHQKIMCIEGSEVLKADVAVYNGGTEGEKYADMDCVDTAVDVEIGCIRVVFVNKFVNGLLGFVDHFQVAKDKVQEAGQAAAQAGMEAVQSLQETATRLGLKVQMKAPVIVVPQSSSSLNSLLLDLGHLSVTNVFRLAGKSSSSGVPAVLEEMKVVLTSLQLSRAMMKQAGGVQSECVVLEPLTISLTMQRNLSAAWYHDHPDIQLGGALEPLTVHLSQGDFATAMQVLNENLSEGAPPTESTSSYGDAVESRDVVPLQSPAKSASDTQDTGLEVKHGAASQAVYTKIQVDFQIKGLILYFYSGDSILTQGRVRHDVKSTLGKFELQVIAMATSIMSDNAISARVSLMDTILNDLRISKQAGITRMIERSKGGSRQSSSMIAVDFNQSAEQEKKVRLGISSLYICVCVEFLMTLADFFTKGLQPSPSDTSAKKVTSASTPASPAKESGKGSGAPGGEAPQGTMDIELDMEKPEIILIEDQMNLATNALVVDMMMSFRMRQTLEEQVMSAGITKLQIFSCTFDRRHQQHTQVLMPCDLSFHSHAKNSKNPHMDVSISDLVLNISPATIATMAAVSAGLSPQNADTGQVKRDEVPERLWEKKLVSECNFWFLQNVNEALEVTESTDMTTSVGVSDLEEGRGEEVEEMLVLKLPSLVIKLEGGIGHRTIPLLIVESSFQAQVKNWSSQLMVEGSLDLEVGYYNEKLAVWEPLIEPVFEESKQRRWQINLEVQKNEDSVEAGADEANGGEQEEQMVILPSKMVINVTSSDALQVSLTKACLEVLNNLGKAFNDAYNLVPLDKKKEEVLSPYLFQNQTGYDIVLRLDASFEPPATSVDGSIALGVGTSLQVYNKVEGVLQKTKASQIKATQQGEERKIIFQLEQFGATREVTVKRAEKRLFHINQKSHQGDTWSVVCNTDCTIGQKLVSLQSIVRVKSELTFPVEVQFRGDTQIETCGIVQPDEYFSLPLNAVYGLSSDLFFKPVGDSYTTSKDPVNWRSAENTGLQEVCCPSVQKGHSACYFSVFPEVEEIYFEAGDEKSGKCCVLALQPSVILHNLLPLAVSYMLEGTSEQQTLQQGENRALCQASFSDTNLEIIIPSYQGKEWVGRRKLQKSMPELTVWELTAHEGSQKLSLELGLHCKLQKGSLDVSLYAPYWLINKTGRTLQYRGSDQDTPVEHPPEGNHLILFSFKGKSFFGGKKKAQLRIDSLEWSDKFSLDTVGSSGTVQCKSKNKDVQSTEVGVAIQLSSSGLTKIATFTPFYMFLNTALDSILVTESDRENWVEIQPGQCQSFWPQASCKDVKVKAKVKDTQEVTGDFLINQAHTTLLRLDNQYGGINADCQVSESSMITTLRTYRAGLATVIVINNTHNCSLTFHQSGQQQKGLTLKAGEAVTYTWNNALGKRELVWTCGKKKDIKNDLIQDGMDEFFADDETKVYWVSFLDGLQRMLLFTEDLAVAASAQEAGELEQVEQEINLQLQGFGLSLVNNYNNSEVAFLGITSSGIIWEERRKRRYRALKLKECHILEAAWQKYQNEILVGKTPHNRVILENKMEVDFADMTVIKPKTFFIRRSFENGIWVQYKTSPHQLQLHAKINRIQLDNQLSHAVFPTVLSPLPPPKSVAADSVPKPFTELSVMMRKHEHSTVSQIKYFKVLIQEMNLKVDQGFLNAILELFAANEPLPREQETIQLKQDVELTEKSLMEVAGLSLAEEQKNFYDYLHFSPIKVHLSFSLQTGAGSSDGKPVEIQAGVISVFLQSVGVVLTDVQDVVFKLGYFERSHSFYNQSQLIGEMTRHYAGQAIKQMYVLVLGLDVLGNPFGLLRGLSEGIEDLFYEPYQGAIQGPEEFAEGLALGVRSLFGHAVGGAAGAVSRITGTLGKGLATLTLDDDYQKKRREQMNKRPATAREGIARGGKGLVMGVVDGVTGIVRKPVEGAKQEGVSGFFKGVGKGLVGVVTRPTSGVVDFASSSFEGIRRIAEVSEDIKRLRPPRRFFKDGVIRPYNHQEAEGYAILQETEKGKYAVTDEYQAHAVVSKDGKHVLIVTDRRVLMAKRGEIFGSWDADWAFVWTELRDDTPKKTAKGIEIVLREEKKKKFFSSSSNKKDVTIADPKVAEWIIGQIQEQMTRMKN